MIDLAVFGRPEFLASFLGVFLAFSLNRLWGFVTRYRDYRTLLRSINHELKDILLNLKRVEQGNLLGRDRWSSAVNSGKILLLTESQLVGLSYIYTRVDHHNYEATRARNLGESRRITPTNGDTSSLIDAEWDGVTKMYTRIAVDIKEKIENILPKSWWP